MPGVAPADLAFEPVVRVPRDREINAFQTYISRLCGIRDAIDKCCRGVGQNDSIRLHYSGGASG